MSGRDLRNFVVHHRTDETDHMVKRVIDGLPTNKYREVDYDQLKQFAAEKKMKGQEKLIKLKKIQEASKRGKDQNLLKQHKAMWRKEFLRLNSQRKKFQAELDHHLIVNKDDDDNFLIYTDLDDVDTQLDQSFIQFKKQTADPLWMLREDLQYWVREYLVSGEVPGEHPDKIGDQVAIVKVQQKQILEKLHNEEISLEQELDSLGLPTILSIQSKRMPRVETGIPEDAFNLDCPDMTLKASVLQEFILIDDRYSEKLEEIEEKYAAALESETGGWNTPDHATFQYVMDQYPYDLHNRRTLYMDRLQKHLPRKTRAQIVEHETWWLLHGHSQQRISALLNDWNRDRRELLFRASAVFGEARQAAQMAEMKYKQHEHQQQLCDTLYSKVTEWREQKLEVMQLEELIADRDRQRVLEFNQQQEEQDKMRRKQQKQQIAQFQTKQETRRKQQDVKDKRRLEELKQILAEQALIDKERVEYRDEEYRRKVGERRHREEERQQEQEEKERVLETLRETVRPHVEADLLRVWSDTTATREHRRKEERYINIQQPLYDTTGFTGKQVLADPRVRLEQELRDQGLIHNTYAREALKQMQPPQEPRRDMHSDLFR